ncbi:MAG: hypothetical protein IPG62_14215 [Sphingomonadales bacterium]|nr:hypothetical protein [Sphingomonadales bacterium]
MKVSVKNGQIILVDDVGAEIRTGQAIMAALRALDGHEIDVQVRSEVCIVLEDLGPREEACREPINITRNADRRYVAISNLYPTPFALDDELYGSVEGFWQSLKCGSVARRRQVAALSGTDAKKAAAKAPLAATFDGIWVKRSEPELTPIGPLWSAPAQLNSNRIRARVKHCLQQEIAH